MILHYNLSAVNLVIEDVRVSLVAGAPQKNMGKEGEGS